MRDPLMPDSETLERLSRRAATLVRDQLSGEGAAAVLTSLDEALSAVSVSLPVEQGDRRAPRNGE